MPPRIIIHINSDIHSAYGQIQQQADARWMDKPTHDYPEPDSGLAGQQETYGKYAEHSAGHGTHIERLIR